MGLKHIRLVDFQALNGFHAALPSVLSWMLRRCREQRVDLLEVTGGWLERCTWPSIRAPYKRVIASWPYYYKTMDRELSEALRDPQVWAPSSIDGDASLYSESHRAELTLPPGNRQKLSNRASLKRNLE